jgi:hypothetical protein
LSAIARLGARWNTISAKNLYCQVKRQVTFEFQWIFFLDNGDMSPRLAPQAHRYRPHGDEACESQVFVELYRATTPNPFPR